MNLGGSLTVLYPESVFVRPWRTRPPPSPIFPGRRTTVPEIVAVAGSAVRSMSDHRSASTSPDARTGAEQYVHEIKQTPPSAWTAAAVLRFRDTGYGTGNRTGFPELHVAPQHLELVDRERPDGLLAATDTCDVPHGGVRVHRVVPGRQSEHLTEDGPNPPGLGGMLLTHGLEKPVDSRCRGFPEQ